MSELIAVIKELFAKDINDYIYIYGTVLGACIAAFFAWKTYALTRKMHKKRLPIKIFELIFEGGLSEYFFKMGTELVQIEDFDFSEFSFALENFKTRIYQFKFYDEILYKELLELTSEVEDYIVLINENSQLSKKIKNKAKVEIALKKIYDCLLDYYSKIEK